MSVRLHSFFPKEILEALIVNGTKDSKDTGDIN